MAKKFSEICGLLELFGDGAVSQAKASAALKGWELEKRGPGKKVLLCEMAWCGVPKAVELVLAKGADVNRTGGDIFTGPAIAHAVANNRSSPATKKRIVKTLLNAGADPNILVSAAYPPVDPDSFRSGTVLDFAIHQAREEAAVDRTYDIDSRRHAASMLKSYRETIPLLIASGGTMSEVSIKRLRALGMAAAKMVPNKAKLDTAKARRLLKNRKNPREAIGELCADVLSPPGVERDPAWAGFVKQAIQASRTFAEVSREVYGKRVSFLDDEGWLAQGWGNYVVLDLVLELLTRPNSLENRDWAPLVRALFHARRKFDAGSYTKDAVAEFFRAKEIKKHPEYKNLRAWERKTR